ncbi:hypothetical protein ACFXGA_39795 [Actinosynnema sp. NPDC059335]|uniref:hypothetical protein n=1 Tax=Actinosynnema sp. NPDC059335 TaxID=3346804 RepID=UPI00366B6736
MDLTFDVEDLVLDELAVTTIADATFTDGEPAVASVSCSCCSHTRPHIDTKK